MLEIRMAWEHCLYYAIKTAIKEFKDFAPPLEFYRGNKRKPIKWMLAFVCSDD